VEPEYRDRLPVEVDHLFDGINISVDVLFASELPDAALEDHMTEHLLKLADLTTSDAPKGSPIRRPPCKRHYRFGARCEALLR
jgi:hypothetical protein